MNAINGTARVVSGRNLQWDSRLKGVRRPTLARDEQLMEISDAVLKCVAFVAAKRNSPGENDNYHLLGTAFFVSYLISGTEGVEDSGAHQVYAVTAKHIIEEVKRRATDANVHLRVNVRQPKIVQYTPIPLSDWQFDDDDRIDVAVAGLPEGFLRDYDCHTVPVGMFADVEPVSHVNPGGDLFFPGLFSQRHGNERNIPIMRTGTVAALPSEPVRTKWGVLPSAYLIEARSIGGISGSPVFSRHGFLISRTPENQTSVALLGLVHGHYEGDLENSDTIREAGTDFGKPLSVNAGIAIVVPIAYVRAVLERPVFKAERERLRHELFEKKKKDLPAPDQTM
jgi:hypothetical protein